jgi:two-component system cell cycle sensor histidine kinase/response regulator CckA
LTLNAKDTLRESEVRYRTLYFSMNEGMVLHEIIYDESGKPVDYRILDVNPAFESILGIKKEGAIGAKGSVIYGMDAAPYLEIFAKVVSTQKPITFETFFEPMGKSFKMSVFSPAKGNFAVLFSDITGRKRDEMFLERSEFRHRTLYETMSQGVLYVNTEFIITAANPAAGRILGAPVEKIIGIGCDDPSWDIIYEDGSVFPIEEYPPIVVLRVGREIRNVVMGVFNQQEQIYRWINVDAVPQFYPGDEKPYQVYIIFDDITERKKLEADIIKADKLESIGVLAGGIAHDFNNLLTGILGNISLARKLSDKGEAVLDVLAESESAAYRARDLTLQLLTFAKGGAPVKKTISLKELVEYPVKFALRGSKVKCEYSIPEDLWPVDVDEGQISQVIHNLAINADQSMSDGGSVRIICENVVIDSSRVSALQPGRYVTFCMEDQGCGIPAEYRKKIFDPYFTTKQKGNGLGLSTVYSIIKKHHGDITVKSEVGTGTRFTVALPASEKEFAEASTSAKEILTGTGRILVMDDEEIVRNAVGRMLEHIGYEVTLASKGAECIDLYKNSKDAGKPFNAVILDLTIPGELGGKETIKQLLELDPKVKAIVSSGYSNDPVMSEYEKYGFRGMMAKPFKLTEVSHLLHDLLTKGQC